MLELGEDEKRPLPVLLVSASQGTGVTELCEELDASTSSWTGTESWPAAAPCACAASF